MYTRAITLPLKTAKVDAAIGVFEKTIAPMFQQKKGFQGGYLVGDRNNGKAVSITVWDTEANASALDSSGFYKEWVGMLDEYLSSPAIREQDEVYLRF